MNIVEYFEMRKREIDEQLAAIESGRVLRLVQETRRSRPPSRESSGERQRHANLHATNAIPARL